MCRMLPPIVWPISKGLGNIVSCQSHVPSATCPYHANDVNMIPLKALDILCFNLAHILVIVTVPHVDWLSRLGSKVKATASGNILVGLVADTEDICHIPVYCVYKAMWQTKKTTVRKIVIHFWTCNWYFVAIAWYFLYRQNYVLLVASSWIKNFVYLKAKHVILWRLFNTSNQWLNARLQ